MLLPTAKAPVVLLLWQTEVLAVFLCAGSATETLPGLGFEPFNSRDSERNRTMSWDEAYNQLQQELGREPNSGEIQRKMLEIAQGLLE
ncbi:MAG: hypothetical protein ACYSWP_12005 [Planctomycetota bacterium]|jgi:hypothetical protein